MNPTELITKLAAMTLEEAKAFLENHSITSDNGLHGAITVTKNDEFNLADIDFVVCGHALPGAHRVDGAIDVECDDCRAMVVLSPSSPLNKPKICYLCAQARINEEQSINE